MAAKTEWHQGNILVSTDRTLFQLSAINDAFGSDSLYWARPIEETLLTKMLDNSLCFGIYEIGSSSTGGDGQDTELPFDSTY